MTSPFHGISDPGQLRALVQDGVECEACGGSGRIDRRDIPMSCATCKGTGHTPLPNADLEALAACWCERIFVRNRIWEEPKNYTHYVLNPPQYRVRGNWVSPPAYTTSPAAAMRLMVKYRLGVQWIRATGGKDTHLFIQRSINPDIPIRSVCVTGQSDAAIEALWCRLSTETALIGALTEAMEGASDE